MRLFKEISVAPSKILSKQPAKIQAAAITKNDRGLTRAGPSNFVQRNGREACLSYISIDNDLKMKINQMYSGSFV